MLWSGSAADSMGSLQKVLALLENLREHFAQKNSKGCLSMISCIQSSDIRAQMLAFDRCADCICVSMRNLISSHSCSVCCPDLPLQHSKWTHSGWAYLDTLELSWKMEEILLVFLLLKTINLVPLHDSDCHHLRNCSTKFLLLEVSTVGCLLLRANPRGLAYGTIN